MSYRQIDLFAGIGGFRLAFERNGCDCVFSSEWDKYSKQTYHANFDETPYGDITKIHVDEIPSHDILTAGFPCQPFSTIGKREGFDHETQGTLFYDIARILKSKKPSSFLLENVQGLTNHDNGRTLETILYTLEKELKYKVYHTVLNSSDYGVPQNRRRIYIVGFSRKVGSKKSIDFTWPEKNLVQVGIGQFVESGLTGYSISEHLQGTYIYKVDDGRPQVITSDSNFPVKTLVSTYHKIQRLTGTFVQDGPTGLRLLSQNECKAIMGLPVDFKFPVSRTQMYRQVGNSVAVPVVQKIAEQMIKTLDEGIQKKKAKLELVA